MEKVFQHVFDKVNASTSIAVDNDDLDDVQVMVPIESPVEVINIDDPDEIVYDSKTLLTSSDPEIAALLCPAATRLRNKTPSVNVIVPIENTVTKTTQQKNLDYSACEAMAATPAAVSKASFANVTVTLQQIRKDKGKNKGKETKGGKGGKDKKKTLKKNVKGKGGGGGGGGGGGSGGGGGGGDQQISWATYSKRMHSRAWHGEYTKQIQAGNMKAGAKRMASLAAKRAMAFLRIAKAEGRLPPKVV